MKDKSPQRRFEASATIEGVAPKKASAIVLDPENLPKWFKGTKDVKAYDGYPAKGGRLSFRVGPSEFSGVVVESDLPTRLVLNVATPSGHSRVTQLFEAKDGGTVHTRIVEATLSGRWGWFAPLYLPGAVRREVKRAAALVASETSKA